jgi:hypothetical protein
MKHVKLITMNINKHEYYLHGLKLDKIILFNRGDHMGKFDYHSDKSFI